VPGCPAVLCGRYWDHPGIDGCLYRRQQRIPLLNQLARCQAGFVVDRASLGDQSSVGLHVLVLASHEWQALDAIRLDHPNLAPACFINPSLYGL